MERPVWAEVNLSAVQANVQAIRKLLPASVGIMAVIKANAYGHGIIPVAKASLANGAGSLAVAIVAEGIQLRHHGFSVPILVMGYTPPEQYRLLLEYKLQQAVFSLEQGQLLSQAALKAGKPAFIHLKIDTGMGRVGFLEDQWAEILAVCRLPGLVLKGVFTHFAAADEPDPTYTLQQLAQFNRILQALKKEGFNPELVHAANSAALIQFPESHFNLVRAGLSIYGLYPSEHVAQAKLPLKPVMSLKTRIAFIKSVPQGFRISYGCTYRTARDSLIATIPLGYADGYPRVLSNKGQVLVNGQLAPVVGRVCMDQTMIDVTHLPRVQVGDEVVLFGADRQGNLLPVEQVAQLAGTINYELVCGVSCRVPRKYVY